MIKTTLIRDTVSLDGDPIRTFYLVMPRYIWPQFLTHRMMSRNASSSRAMRVSALIQDARSNPIDPVWRLAQKGMVAGPLVADTTEYQKIWNEARESALDCAQRLTDLGGSKEIVNRILEPYTHIHAVATATTLDNFFKLRIAYDAQEEVQLVAQSMLDAIEASKPIESNQHIPLFSPPANWATSEQIKDISVSQMARVSYRQTEEERKLHSTAADLKLANRLLSNGHYSPFEHQAFAAPGNWDNFQGWRSYRNQLQGDYDEFVTPI